MAFTGKYDSCSEFGVEEISTVELAETYKKLLIEWKDYRIKEENKNKIMSVFLREKEKILSTITWLEEEVKLLNFKLENMSESVHMMTNSSKILEDVL